MSKHHRKVSLEQFIDSFEDPSKIASLTDFGMGVNGLVSYCDREARLWDELQAVERACRKLRQGDFRQTVRTVYRVLRFESGSQNEQRALILRILRVNDRAYRKRMSSIIRILTRSKREPRA